MPDGFAQVAFPIPLKTTYTYEVPAPLMGWVKEGARVAVSFGRRQTVGMVASLHSSRPEKVALLKPIETLLDSDPLLTPDLLELGRWMADYYACSLGEAWFAMLPGGFRKAAGYYLQLTEKGIEREPQVKEALEKAGKMRGISFDSLKEGKVAYSPRTRKLAAFLKDSGYLALVPRTGVMPDAIPVKVPVRRKTPPVLHGQQEEALKPILAALKDSGFKPFLIQGITGSGKTEVYLRAIAECIQAGKQALVLVPEIALTPLMVERFTGRFGAEVAVLHSRMTPTERTAQWTRVASGQAKVALGARSALFAPARDLGLIVVDEEHEPSYKQEDSPRYHARDAAVKRAQLCKCPVVLGTATPSLESYHNAKSGKYVHLLMPERVNKRPLPRIRMVDLKEEWDARPGDRPVLTLALQEAVRETLSRREQALLFLNRRGFTSMTLCLQCGEPVQCPHCSVAVTYHQRLGVKHEPGLLCHYCNWHGPLGASCAKCGGAEVKQVGLGTQKVEEELKVLFPQARVGRLDLDATRKAGSLERTLREFGEGKIDLLVGTQMIAKGHDFPGVTLVGIVGADTGLALPDFRASERVFQLLVQVSGRAGRSEKEGVIYLQTFRPEHECLRAALSQDVTAFLESELPLRKALGYPPFSRLCLIHQRGSQERKVHEASEKAGEWLRRNAGAYGVEVRGPAPAPLYRLRGHYRFQILLKCAQPGPLRRLVAAMESRIEVPQGVHRSIDMDPQSML